MGASHGRKDRHLMVQVAEDMAKLREVEIRFDEETRRRQGLESDLRRIALDLERVAAEERAAKQRGAQLVAQALDLAAKSPHPVDEPGDDPQMQAALSAARARADEIGKLLESIGGEAETWMRDQAALFFEEAEAEADVAALVAAGAAPTSAVAAFATVSDAPRKSSDSDAAGLVQRAARAVELEARFKSFGETHAALKVREESITVAGLTRAREWEEAKEQVALLAQPSAQNGWASDPCSRGVNFGKLLAFFEEYCGQIVFEDTDVGEKPLCVAARLMRLCTKWNREHQSEIASGQLAALRPDMYAVERLIIRPLTAAERQSVAQLWHGEEGVTADVFVSHAWSENFGEFCQGLYLCLLRCAALDFPSNPAAQIDGLARGLVLWLSGFADSWWRPDVVPGRALEDMAFYRVLQAPTTKFVVVSMDRSAAMLGRAWCNYEVYAAHLLEKPLVLATSSGPQEELTETDKATQLFAARVLEFLTDVDINGALALRTADIAMIRAQVSSLEGKGLQRGLVGGAVVNQIVKRAISELMLPLLARAGLVASLRIALDCGAKPDTDDDRGVPALTYAVGLHGEDHETARLLVARGADRSGLSRPREVCDMFHAADFATRSAAMASVRSQALHGGLSAEVLDAAEREHASAAIRSQLAALRSPDARRREAAVHRLGDIGKFALPHQVEIIALVYDEDAGVRAAAIAVSLSLRTLEEEAGRRVVGKVGETWQELVAAESRAESNSIVGASIGGGGPHPAAVGLLLDNENWIVRHSALHSLLKKGPLTESLAASVAKCLRDERPEVRRAAARVLAAGGAAAAQHAVALSACLADADAETRAAAAAAVAALGAVSRARSALPTPVASEYGGGP